MTAEMIKPGQDVHDSGQCTREDHDRSLPEDGKLTVRYNNDGLAYSGYDFEAALATAERTGSVVTCSEQTVAEDGLLGCNDDGTPLYYCQNTGWYHHVDPEQACFMVGAEVFNYYPEGVHL